MAAVLAQGPTMLSVHTSARTHNAFSSPVKLEVPVKKILRSALISTVALAGLLSGLVPAQAGHSWGDWHWARASNPVALDIVDSMEGKWNPLLPLVNSDWNQSSVIENRVAAGSDLIAEREACLPIDGKIHACNAPYADATWLGLATVYPVDLKFEHIKMATVQVNDTWFLTPLYDNDIARRHVLCQEVGHVFGLDHNYSEPTCMDDVDGLFDAAYQKPGSHDMQQLSSIYQHTEGSGGCKGKGCKNVSGAGLDVQRNVTRVNGRIAVQFIFYPRLSG